MNEEKRMKYTEDEIREMEISVEKYLYCKEALEGWKFSNTLEKMENELNNIMICSDSEWLVLQKTKEFKKFVISFYEIVEANLFGLADIERQKNVIEESFGFGLNRIKTYNGSSDEMSFSLDLNEEDLRKKNRLVLEIINIKKRFLSSYPSFNLSEKYSSLGKTILYMRDNPCMKKSEFVEKIKFFKDEVKNFYIDCYKTGIKNIDEKVEKYMKILGYGRQEEEDEICSDIAVKAIANGTDPLEDPEYKRCYDIIINRPKRISTEEQRKVLLDGSFSNSSLKNALIFALSFFALLTIIDLIS